MFFDQAQIDYGNGIPAFFAKLFTVTEGSSVACSLAAALPGNKVNPRLTLERAALARRRGRAHGVRPRAQRVCGPNLSAEIEPPGLTAGSSG